MWRGWGWNEEDRVGCREKQRQKKELENDAHRDQRMLKPPGLLHWASRLQVPCGPLSPCCPLIIRTPREREKTTGLE